MPCRGRRVTRVVPTHVGVDRTRHSPPSSTRSRPHARGGGPGPLASKLGFSSSSPRTWGWTDGHLELAHRVDVVPTHVGVDRKTPSTARSGSGRPHARGGGPYRRPPCRSGHCGFPTHVGVDRRDDSGYRHRCCRPHARGGGPAKATPAGVAVASSPRTWGWTASDRHPRAWLMVVPTHVGVDRAVVNRPGGIPSRPHARGGGPAQGPSRMGGCWSSPRTWGWTVRHAGPTGHRRVVPTHVGVDRVTRFPDRLSVGRPHARGGGPKGAKTIGIGGASSPRTWGWTGEDQMTADRTPVVPTHVGVDRRKSPPERASWGRPHARGGGPDRLGHLSVVHQSSPRTWGWTVETRSGAMASWVVPTHVGVDRTLARCSRWSVCRPHARGGGPTQGSTWL